MTVIINAASLLAVCLAILPVMRRHRPPRSGTH